MKKYRFSMTGASLLVSEFVNLAGQLIAVEYEVGRLSSEGLDRDRSGTRKREFRELTLRLSTLSKDEIDYLYSTSLENQQLITFLSCVRLYDILKEFIDEVVLYKLQAFDYQLDSMSFNSFLYNKSIDHEEINSLSEVTKKKVQQVIFKLFEQAGLIDSVRTKKLQIPFLDYDIKAIISDAEYKYLLNI